MISKLNISKFVRLLISVTLPLLLFTFFSGISNPAWIYTNVELRWVLGLFFLLLMLIPALSARFIFTAPRSRWEFSIISQITTVVVISAFLQINNRTNITTTIPLLNTLGLDLSWGLGAGLIILLIIYCGVHYDLIYGKFVSEYRIRFTTAFCLQLVLSLSFFSYVYMLQASDLPTNLFRSYLLQFLISIPIWLHLLGFVIISTLITVFYFGRANILPQPRPRWAKVGWRLLVFFIFFQLSAVLMVLPQNYWWKVLFFILVWDFLVPPLARIYKQSTDLFWEKLQLSLAYHTVLFLIVFWISPK